MVDSERAAEEMRTPCFSLNRFIKWKFDQFMKFIDHFCAEKTFKNYSVHIEKKKRQIARMMNGYTQGVIRRKKEKRKVWARIEPGTS